MGYAVSNDGGGDVVPDDDDDDGVILHLSWWIGSITKI